MAWSHSAKLPPQSQPQSVATMIILHSSRHFLFDYSIHLKVYRLVEMFRTLIRRQEYNAANAPLRSYSNPYKAKKTWPPDFTKLSHKYQFRLERRYRRRTKLKWARPKWHKFVKTMTWGSILCMSRPPCSSFDPPSTNNCFSRWCLRSAFHASWR